MSIKINNKTDVNQISLGEIVIVESKGEGTEYVSIKAPALATSLSIVLPNSNGTNGQVLSTDGYGNLSWASSSSSGVSSITAGTGISVDKTTGAVTVTNSSPDQTVKFTNGTGISVTGTYPDFTITNSLPDQTVSLTAGTSISITGTYPSFTIAYTGTNLSEAEDLIALIRNNTGSTLTKGTIVYINGGLGNKPTVAKALASSDDTSAQTFGIVRADISNNSDGYLVIVGSLIDIDTSAYVEGTQLYLSGTTAGTWTSTKPSAPTHLVYVGIVVRSHPTQGVVTVKIQNGYELDEIHDVSITSVANNNILQYNSSTKLWTNVAGTTKNISEDTNLYYTDTRARSSISSSATGLTYTSGTGVFSLTSGYSIPTTASQTNWDTAYTQTQQWNGSSTNLVASTGRTSLGLVIGTNVQAWDADLDAIAAIAGTTGLLKKTAANTWSLDTSTYLTANQTITLSGDVSGSGTTAITTTLATVPITKGGTGQTTANAAVNALLPSQTSNSGKYLTTDGTNSSWGTVSSGASIPSASMQMFAGAITQTVSAGVVTTTAPTGWLLCNGNAVSRSTYSALWTALGTTSSPYGQGDGTTTFNLPDLRGRLPMGSGTGLGLNASGTGVTSGTAMTARALGAWFGEETHLLTTTELASHTHANTVSGGSTSTAGGSHTHAPSGGSLFWVYNAAGANTVASGSTFKISADGSTATTASTNIDHTHTFTPSISNVAAGSNGRHDTISPVLVVNYIIKT